MNNEYRIYLQKQGYTISTVANYLRIEKEFGSWCEQRGSQPQAAVYPDIIAFLKHLQRKGNSKRTVNHTIGRLKAYFNWLLSNGERLDNPCDDVLVKGAKRKMLYNLLNEEELEDLYYSYPTQNIKDPRVKLITKRNKVIVGLMVYQGLTTGEISKLRTNHVLLDKGRIEVPKSGRSNSRTLELKPWQMLEMMRYLEEVRPALYEYGRKGPEQLFISPERRGTGHMQQFMASIIRKLKTINAKVVNAKHIRASVITGWLNHYNLRKVQKMAGHRYISSTEQYRQDDMENLQEAVKRYHPLKHNKSY